MWAQCARTGEYGYSEGKIPCWSVVYALGHHDELLALIAKSAYRYKSWHYGVRGAKALAGQVKRAKAILYVGSKLDRIRLWRRLGILRVMPLYSGFADEVSVCMPGRPSNSSTASVITARTSTALAYAADTVSTFCPLFLYRSFKVLLIRTHAS